jgi:hypothetical protein
VSLSYHSSLARACRLPALTHASKPSAVHKVAESLDLVTSQVLNKRKQVNTFDIECLSVRKFDMYKELFFFSGGEEKRKVFARQSRDRRAFTLGLAVLT